MPSAELVELSFRVVDRMEQAWSSRPTVGTGHRDRERPTSWCPRAARDRNLVGARAPGGQDPGPGSRRDCDPGRIAPETPMAARARRWRSPRGITGRRQRRIAAPRPGAAAFTATRLPDRDDGTTRDLAEPSQVGDVRRIAVSAGPPSPWGHPGSGGPGAAGPIGEPGWEPSVMGHRSPPTLPAARTRSSRPGMPSTCW
jgi:hypothetical protein